jgi:hypothetical protein
MAKFTVAFRRTRLIFEWRIVHPKVRALNWGARNSKI